MLTKQSPWPLRIPLTLAVILLSSSLYEADAAPKIADLSLEGSFHGFGEGELELQIVALDFESHQFGVAAKTGDAHGCSGDLRGIAKAIDAATLVLAKKKEADRSCRLTLKFSDAFRKVTVSGDDCSFFHGASCSFDGTLDRKKQDDR